MNNIQLLITIISRKDTEDFISFYEKYNVGIIYSTPCVGTAHKKTLDLLGIEQTDKTLLFSVLASEDIKMLSRKLSSEMDIDLPGRGIAISLPVSSIGGGKAMDYFLNGQEVTDAEEIGMNSKYELILAICEKGYSDIVMDAAREAGANGGTVIRAKGTGAKYVEKFFGMSIADEKEIIFIVSPTSKKNDIMKGIMRDAGIESKAHTLLISIPVSETAGFKLMEQ